MLKENESQPLFIKNVIFKGDTSLDTFLKFHQHQTKKKKKSKRPLQKRTLRHKIELVVMKVITFVIIVRCIII